MTDPFEKEDEELVVICDSDGKRSAMRHLATVSMGNHKYHVLGSMEEDEGDGIILVREETTSDGTKEYVIASDEQEIEDVVGRFIMQAVMKMVSSVMEAEHADDGISPCGMKHRPGEFCVCEHPDFLQ